MSEDILQNVETYKNGTSIPESCYYEKKDLCSLVENDFQCGEIFYNDDTRLLKFSCIYCKETFYNVWHFCEHLSEHIDEDETDLKTSVKDTTNLEETDISDNFEEYYSGLDNSLSSKESLNRPDENIAELDESALLLKPAFPKTANEYLSTNTGTEIGLLKYAVSNDYKIPKSGMPHIYNDSIEPIVQETKYITSANIHKDIIIPASNSALVSGCQNAPNSKKKVTTVKVIAVKNRIAELYNKIKLEEKRRTPPKGTEGHPETSNEDSQSSKDTYSDSNVENTPPVVIRKMIGETLITHIPYAVRYSNQNTIPGKAHFNNNDNTCPACGERFRNAFSLAIHKRKHYLESKSLIKLAHKCSNCNQLFNRISEMKDHLQKVHYPEGFICKICNKKLTSISLLEAHMRKVHLSRPFSCKICKKNFENRDVYEAHVNSHASNEILKCEICGRKYSSKSILKLHLDRHKERKPQCCVVCGKMTLRITQHMKIHTPRPKRILSCSICDKHFNYSSGLSHHIKKGHREIVLGFAKRMSKQDKVVEQIGLMERENEAKRVIVELIENGSNSTLTETYLNPLEAAPPIAREEIISAVNSIVDC